MSGLIERWNWRHLHSHHAGAPAETSGCCHRWGAVSRVPSVSLRDGVQKDASIHLCSTLQTAALQDFPISFSWFLVCAFMTSLKLSL